MGEGEDVLEFSLIIQKIAGTVSDKSYLSKINTFVQFASLIIGLSTYILQAIHYDRVSALVVVEAIHWAGAFITILICSIYLYLKTTCMKNIIKTVKKGFFDYSNPLTEEQLLIREKANNEVRMVSKWFTLVIFFACFSCIILKGPIFSGKIDNPTSEVNMKLIYPGWYPFEINTWLRYSLVIAFQTFLSLLIPLHACGFLITYVSLTCHLTRQFEMLQSAFRESFKRSEIDELNKDENVLYEGIVECIRHHQVLIKFFNQIQSTFNLILFILFLNAGMMLCTLGYIVVDANSDINQIIPYSLILIPEVSLFFLFCMYGQRITDEAENLRSSIYNVPWYEHSNKIRFLIIFALMRTKASQVVSAYGLKSMSLLGFSETMQTSYSYFNMMIASKGN